MRNYKIYRKQLGTYLSENKQLCTLTSISRDSYRLMLSKAACISLFFSLLNHSLPANPFKIPEIGSSLGNTSNILLDPNVGHTSNLELDPILSASMRPTINNEDIFNAKIIDDFILEHNKYINAIYNFLDKEHLSIDNLETLLDSMTLENAPFGILYSDRKSAMDALLSENKSYEVKFLIVMARDGYTYEQLDYMCAGIVGEATGDGSCYEDAYAVASTLINRSHTLWYVNKYGHNFYAIFKAPGQYEIEVSGNYLKYLGAIELEGYHAAIEALYTRESMHEWLQFRARWVNLNCAYEQFVPGGNKFIDRMKESNYVPYPEEEIELTDVKVFVNSMKS